MKTPEPHRGFSGRTLIDAGLVGLALLIALTVRIDRTVESPNPESAGAVRAAALPFAAPSPPVPAGLESGAMPIEDAISGRIAPEPVTREARSSSSGIETHRIEIRTQEWFRDLDRRLHVLRGTIPAIEVHLESEDAAVVRAIEKITRTAGETICKQTSQTRCS